MPERAAPAAADVRPGKAAAASSGAVAPQADDGSRPAPLPVRWIEELVNTRNMEARTDDIATPEALASWLRARRLLPAAATVTAADLARAVTIRDGLRALIAVGGSVQVPGRPAGGSAVSAGGSAAPAGIDPAALDDLAALARELPLVLRVTDGTPRLAPGDSGVSAALAALLAVVAQAAADGTWQRMKVCREVGCRWAYYDHSRNRSRAWCSMSVCGNRAKARAFRRRLAGAAASQPVS